MLVPFWQNMSTIQIWSSCLFQNHVLNYSWALLIEKVTTITWKRAKIKRTQVQCLFPLTVNLLLLTQCQVSLNIPNITILLSWWINHQWALQTLIYHSEVCPIKYDLLLKNNPNFIYTFYNNLNNKFRCQDCRENMILESLRKNKLYLKFRNWLMKFLMKPNRA